jgi:hypothetical protein
MQRKICIPPSTCSSQSRVIISEECLCGSGQYLQSDELACAASCPSNEVKDPIRMRCRTTTQCTGEGRLVEDQECRCSEGRYHKNLECVHDCGVGYLKDLNVKACIQLSDCLQASRVVYED